MNRKWWKFLFLLPISVCTLYAGGYAAQFIKNYQEWTSAGNFAGNGTYPQAASYTHWYAFILPLPISHTICMGFFFAWFSLGFLLFYLCVWDMTETGRLVTMTGT